MAKTDTYFGREIFEERISPLLCFEICDPAFQHRKVFCCVHFDKEQAVSETVVSWCLALLCV